MPSPVKHSFQNHDKHYDIYNDTREHMKAMESRYSEKEVSKVCSTDSSVCIGKWISAPPCTFMIKMRPFPCLAAQECKSAKDCKHKIFCNTFSIHAMPFVYCQY